MNTIIIYRLSIRLLQLRILLRSAFLQDQELSKAVLFLDRTTHSYQGTAYDNLIILFILLSSSAKMGNSDSKPEVIEIPLSGAGEMLDRGDQHHVELSEPLEDIILGMEARDESDTQESANNSSKIRDDQIQVNLAMADLMGYLQVVANNSNQLPLTRRDDPELDRIVSSLTSDEYARKSAAFLPADIRVIGGTFTRYGRVWDLPTNEVRINRFTFVFEVSHNLVHSLIPFSPKSHTLGIQRH